MIDEIRLRKDAAKGERAKALLENDLVIEAYDKIEQQLVAAWVESEPRDNDGRERLWNAVQANRKHKAYLQVVVSDGRLALAEIAQAESLEDQMKRNRV